MMSHKFKLGLLRHLDFSKSVDYLECKSLGMDDTIGQSHNIILYLMSDTYCSTVAPGPSPCLTQTQTTFCNNYNLSVLVQATTKQGQMIINYTQNICMIISEIDLKTITLLTIHSIMLKQTSKPASSSDYHKI